MYKEGKLLTQSCDKFSHCTKRHMVWRVSREKMHQIKMWQLANFKKHINTTQHTSIKALKTGAKCCLLALLNNINNNTNWWQCLWRCHYGEAIVRVHPVHLTNAHWALDGRQTSNQANRLGLCLLSSTATISLYFEEVLRMVFEN